MSGTTPDPPPMSSAGVAPIPDEPSADGPAYFDRVADEEFVMKEAGDLALGQPLDGELDRRAVTWRRGD